MMSVGRCATTSSKYTLRNIIIFLPSSWGRDKVPFKLGEIPEEKVEEWTDDGGTKSVVSRLVC